MFSSETGLALNCLVHLSFISQIHLEKYCMPSFIPCELRTQGMSILNTDKSAIDRSRIIVSAYLEFQICLAWCCDVCVTAVICRTRNIYIYIIPVIPAFLRTYGTSVVPTPYI